MLKCPLEKILFALSWKTPGKWKVEMDQDNHPPGVIGVTNFAAPKDSLISVIKPGSLIFAWTY